MYRPGERQVRLRVVQTWRAAGQVRSGQARLGVVQTWTASGQIFRSDRELFGSGSITRQVKVRSGQMGDVRSFGRVRRGYVQTWERQVRSCCELIRPASVRPRLGATSDTEERQAEQSSVRGCDAWDVHKPTGTSNRQIIHSQELHSYTGPPEAHSASSGRPGAADERASPYRRSIWRRTPGRPDRPPDSCGWPSVRAAGRAESAQSAGSDGAPVRWSCRSAADTETEGQRGRRRVISRIGRSHTTHELHDTTTAVGGCQSLLPGVSAGRLLLPGVPAGVSVVEMSFSGI